MAGNARAEVHLPCVRAGEALHDDKAQAPGGSRALRDSQRPPPLGKPRRGSGVAGLLRALVCRVGRLPQGEGDHRRQGPVQARTAEKGAPQPREARARRHAVHLPRCEAAGRRSRSRHEQPDRRRRECPAARDAQAPSGHGPGAAHQGDIVVVLPAYRVPASRSRHPARDAHRREHSRPLPGCGGRKEKRRRRRQMGRRGHLERPAYERSLEKRLELGHRVHVLSYNPLVPHCTNKAYQCFSYSFRCNYRCYFSCACSHASMTSCAV